MFPKKKDTGAYIFFGAAIYLLAIFAGAHFGYLEYTGLQFTDALSELVSHIKTAPFEIFPIQWNTILFVSLIFAFAVVMISLDSKINHIDLPGNAQDSAHWNTKLTKYNKQYTEPFGKSAFNGENNMILSQNVRLGMDGRKTRRNNNILVIGGSGTGKSRFFVKPNVLQENCSYVITDPSGELVETVGGALKKKGYEVKIFNLVQMSASNRYNPFNYIRDDPGVVSMINCLIKNTTPKGSSGGDPFWEKTETALLQAICFYLYHCCKPEDRNFANVMRMLRLAEVKEDQDDFESILDIMFRILEHKNMHKYEDKGLPVVEHIACTQYKIFKMGAGKTLKSILISVSVRLTNFNLKDVRNITSNDNIDLVHIGDKKTALFCVIPSANTTFNYLVSMMYSQLFESLYYHAENQCDHKVLKYPVRFMLDEFANIGQIPEFNQKLATMRKYNISCSIIIQNLAQIKAMYKDDWETLVGNCDSIVFLGSPEQSTLEYISKKLGNTMVRTRSTNNSYGSRGSTSHGFSEVQRPLLTTSEISKMNNNDCIVFVRGLSPFYDKKYNYSKHPNYKETGDYKDKLIWNYRDDKAYDASKICGGIDSNVAITIPKNNVEPLKDKQSLDVQQNKNDTNDVRNNDVNYERKTAKGKDTLVQNDIRDDISDENSNLEDVTTSTESDEKIENLNEKEIFNSDFEYQIG